MNASELAAAWSKWSGRSCCGTVILAGARPGAVTPWVESVVLKPLEEVVSDGSFVWEAILYTPEEFSVTVRHADGKWIVNEIRWGGKEPAAALTEAGIQFHETKTLTLNAPPMRWLELWEPRPVPECDGAAVLTQTFQAFVGFTTEED
jgi:CRISPR type III-associated protein (TIGR04423 family)